ncbi:type VI secretion system baseplate subunit TssF [Paraburkholderia sp. LEh10]|uniref:type VI secretion system baseplate subunit TssF n=1 Tax=Paraburkholderia sp. LEh10 TaxID=2821353 RepID=UPI001AE3C0AB|nr:type VI secretion system baseplate subunit TssF [Paraburkholderia sp. LEh10]MBP0590309.1 type VI secretion system baseplate subunit TssF [Paraburkholderia sp. LEh10]
MDPRLLRYYNRELQHVREMGAEFASEYPKIAGRLGMEGFECADPYVERLLEGFAFLAARVQLKLDAQYPVFTQHLLEMIYPHYLTPVPSMAVVQLHPDQAEDLPPAGHPVARHTVLRSLVGFGERTACEYRTAHDVTLWPLAITDARYFDTPAALAAAGLMPPSKAGQVRAGLRVKLKTLSGVQVNTLALDSLPVYLAGADDLPRAIYEQLMANRIGYTVRTTAQDGQIVETHHQAAALRAKGFDEDEAMLPYGGRSFSGYRLLQEYFACPERFLFAEFTGLHSLLARSRSNEFEIVVWLDRSVSRLHNAIDAGNFRLFCTPAVNLFERRADRIHLQRGDTEYHVLSDRTRPMDFEVHSVMEVQGYGDRQEPEQSFLPFYDSTARTWHSSQAAFYTLRREPRLLSSRQKQRGARSSYIGSETFIALVDANDAPYATTLRQLELRLLCTNRDLPLHMSVGKSYTDFTLDTDAPVSSIRCVAGPTRPRASTATGESAWRLISHLQLNYLSLLDQEGDTGAAALREMLGLYHDQFDTAARRQIEGIKHVAAKPVTRRVPAPGPIMYGRGLEITLTCDDAAFEGSGAFVLASVLQHFFARYVSLNSFAETVLRTLERNEVARWTANPGKRPIL